MKFRLISGEERLRYNQFVYECPYGHFLQLFEWGDVKADTGWRPFRAVVEDNGAILAAALVLIRSLPVLGRSIMYIPRGPAVDWERKDVLHVLWQGLSDLGRRERAVFLKVDPEVPKADEQVPAVLKTEEFVPFETGKSFESIQPRFAMPLSIAADATELLQSFHHKTRYNIRLAGRRGVTVREGRKNELPEFYKLLQETAERDRFLIRGFEYYEALWQNMIEPGHARLFVAHYNEEMIAATIVFRCGKKAWYIYGASGNRHRNVMPNYLLQWEMILWAKQHGCEVYDFGGVSGEVDPGHPLYGLYRFKKGFGAKLVEYHGEFDLPLQPSMYWLWTKVMPTLRSARSRLIRSTRTLIGR